MKCDYCAHYLCDEDDGEYYCDISLDEDEVEAFMRSSPSDCPYYNPYDEYGIVKKQN